MNRVAVAASLIGALAGSASVAWAVSSGGDAQVPDAPVSETRAAATLTAAQRELADQPELSLDHVRREFTVAGNDVYSATGKTGRCILVVGREDAIGTIRTMGCAPVTTVDATSLEVPGPASSTTILWTGTGATNITANDQQGTALKTITSGSLTAVSRPVMARGARIAWDQGDNPKRLEVMSRAELTRQARAAIEALPESSRPLGVEPGDITLEPAR